MINIYVGVIIKLIKKFVVVSEVKNKFEIVFSNLVLVINYKIIVFLIMVVKFMKLYYVDKIIFVVMFSFLNLFW